MRKPAVLDYTRFCAAPPLARAVGGVLAALALSACSVFGGQRNVDVAGEFPDSEQWSQMQLGELEAEIAQLKTENSALQERLAELQREAAPPVAGAAPDIREGSETMQKPSPSAATAPAVKPETVVAAADADRALADAPEKPVESSPRLVQPSFASGQETTFENEAPGEIKTASVLYGVHLASYRGENEARAGWRKLQREYPDELGLLEPRIELVAIEGRGDFLRLIGGGFSSREKAETLCGTLKTRGVYCAVTGFDGERLSLADGQG